MGVIITSKRALSIREQAIALYPKTQHTLYVGAQHTFQYVVIGTTSYKQIIEQQLKSIARGSNAGKLLLQELSKLPKVAIIIEANSSHAFAHKEDIILLHNAISSQGYGKGRFEDAKGRRLVGSFRQNMTLAHELFHIGQLQKANFFKPHCNWVCINPWGNNSMIENDAIRYTNQIRLQKNYGMVRTHHAANGGLVADSYQKAQSRVNVQ